jgi:hypothetical protein
MHILWTYQQYILTLLSRVITSTARPEICGKGPSGLSLAFVEFRPGRLTTRNALPGRQDAKVDGMKESDTGRATPRFVKRTGVVGQYGTLSESFAIGSGCRSEVCLVVD